ncbi:60S ribosomal protein L24 [Hyalella azteca]|uniref:Large ribosomal subunit protein eL24 n=1 Tax=Hyalella azteca TaxID=294128 RepID=A0A8B7PGL5_HYAAZ|nr:60S ribosomal protein L24 [Hyalella azteca]
MKLQLCSYSGYKIHPGHGSTLVRNDGKTFVFLNSKCRRSHLMKRSPREVTWTVLYRRKHRKGQEEESSKKRTRRHQKFQRAIVGASLTDILAKRNMKPEVRKAQREQAIRALKEKNRAAKAAKKPATTAAPKLEKGKSAMQKVAKPMPKPKMAKTGGHGGRR